MKHGIIYICPYCLFPVSQNDTTETNQDGTAHTICATSHKQGRDIKAMVATAKAYGYEVAEKPSPKQRSQKYNSFPIKPRENYAETPILPHPNGAT